LVIPILGACHPHSNFGFCLVLISLDTEIIFFPAAVSPSTRILIKTEGADGYDFFPFVIRQVLLEDFASDYGYRGEKTKITTLNRNFKSLTQVLFIRTQKKAAA
jgi:hypothetical protein